MQAAAPDPDDPAALLVGPYVRKVEALRKRLDAVTYTLSRVQVRVESLQDAVTRSERAQRQARAAAAVAAAAATASGAEVR